MNTALPYLEVPCSDTRAPESCSTSSWHMAIHTWGFLWGLHWQLQ